jgi:cyclopropane-fatty-acyl-phospholipid synthase
LRLLQKAYQSAGRPPIRLMLENGPGVSSVDGRPIASIVIRDRRTLLELIFDTEVSFGDAYSEGRITVEGDLVGALEAIYRSVPNLNCQNWYTAFASRCVGYVQRNSLRGARKNIHRHYDLNNGFFRLWLDPELEYSCAYFPTDSTNLDDAQTAKMDYICRKLNLQPGERVVDIGSGWGALALYMAKNYAVIFWGYSISHEQICWARRRAQEMDLGDRVELVEDDYRNVSGTYDAVVSVGMLEHVGAKHFAEMGRLIDRSLSPAGRGLLHTIGRNGEGQFSNWIRKRIFPGAYAPTLRQLMDIFEPSNFTILDAENLRSHYARTLEHWLERFEDSTLEVPETFGPEFVRTWRLYLAGSIAGFRVGTLQLFQIVFARAACQRIPSTRAQLYHARHDETQEADVSSTSLH